MKFSFRKNDGGAVRLAGKKKRSEMVVMLCRVVANRHDTQLPSRTAQD
jgi:hypothetical protein